MPNLASTFHKTALTVEQLLLHFSSRFCQQETGNSYCAANKYEGKPRGALVLFCWSFNAECFPYCLAAVH